MLLSCKRACGHGRGIFVCHRLVGLDPQGRVVDWIIDGNDAVDLNLQVERKLAGG